MFFFSSLDENLVVVQDEGQRPPDQHAAGVNNVLKTLPKSRNGQRMWSLCGFALVLGRWSELMTEVPAGIE